MQDTTAVILAGGLGTRLRAAVSALPKVLAPVAGRPFVGHLLASLARQGIRRVVLCSGYKADILESALGTSYEGLALSYSREESPLGTAGAARLALGKVEGPRALVLNGDSFCEVDLAAMARAHAATGAAATLLL